MTVGGGDVPRGPVRSPVGLNRQERNLLVMLLDAEIQGMRETEDSEEDGHSHQDGIHDVAGLRDRIRASGPTDEEIPL